MHGNQNNPSRRATLGALAVLASGATVGLTGCGSQSGPVAKRDKSAKPKIALVMKSLANEFFGTMAEGAKKHQAANAGKYELIVNGIPDERDVTRQSALVAEMVAQGVDAIVIAPADSKALATPLKRAAEKGVRIVNIDNKLDEEVLEKLKLKIPFVGPNNQAGAQKVGEYLADKLSPGSEVAILEGVVTSFNSQQRRDGFGKAIFQSRLKLVKSQSAQWETGPANQVAASILAANPDLKAIFCCNDNMALGALAAVKAAGKTGKVQIVGFDNISAVQAAIKAGEILATADQHGDQLAVFGIETALALLDDKIGENDKETPVDLITREKLP
jgi:ribose transport system substrate-binding protein